MARETGKQPRETGKQRRSRIELRYYKVRDDQAWWRVLLIGLALLVATAWVVVAPIWDRDRATEMRFFQQSRLASNGPLARPHAIWESTCEACHLPYVPVNGSHWTPSFWTGSHAGDQQCQTCHAGPPHHATQREQDVPSCADCHREHQGRNVSLLAMDDSVCTACHQNLTKHWQPKPGDATLDGGQLKGDAVRQGASPFVHTPRGCPRPEFGADQVQSRAAPGRRPDPGERRGPVHPRKPGRGIQGPPNLSEAGGRWRPAARAPECGIPGPLRLDSWRDLKTPIRLECASCHQLDGEEYGLGLERRMANLVPPRASGASMLAVTYENHCRACHPLQFDQNLPDRQVRHGVSPRDVVDELRQFYTAEVIRADPALLQRFVPPRPLPGQPVPREVASAGQAVEDKLLTAVKLLFGSAVEEAVQKREGLPPGRRGCVECHELKPSAQPFVRSEAASSLEIQPVVVRSLWFESAVFNHATHRALECAVCHEKVSESKDQSRLLLPSIAQCVGCHAPASSRDGQVRGGVSMACTECHRYHNGDHPAQGVGASARRGAAAMSLERFLSGGAATR